MSRPLRLWIAMAAFGAALVSGGAAVAAEPAWPEEFIALCGNNPADFDAAIRSAPGRGFKELTSTAEEPLGLRTFDKEVDGGHWLLLVQTSFNGKSAKNVGQPAYVSRTCGLSGHDASSSGVEAVKAWIGFPPAQTKSGMISFVFRITDGRRISLAGASNAAFDAALADGGYWFSGISVDPDGLVTLSLTHIKLAP